MNEKIRKIVNDPKFVPVITGVVSFGIGLGIGYVFGRNHKKEIHIVPKQPFNHEEMEAFLEREEAKRGIVKEKTVTKEVTIETPVVDHSTKQGEDFVAQQLEREIQNHQGLADESEAIEVRRSVFAENTDDWDYDEELKHRSRASPYILHKDEFYGEEMSDDGYSQTTLTYYAGDDIMVNEDDSPLYNYGSIVGPLKFGHGSDDPKVFYVRNDRRKAEYEIIHDQGLYSEEILGLEIENNQRVKALNRHDKFRESD